MKRGIAGWSLILLLFWLASSSRPVCLAGQTPASAEQLVQQGLQALRAKRFSEAEGQLSAALKVRPHWPEVRADLGLAYYAGHKYPEAVRAFERALSEKPSLQTARVFLPLSLAAGGRCKDAEPGLREVFDSVSDPKLRRVSGLSLERCLIQGGQSRDADQITQKLLEDYPNDPDVLFEAAQFYANLSSTLNLRLMRVASGSARTYQMMGNVAAAQGNWEEAIHAYRRALRADPGLEGAHLQIAVLTLSHSTDPNAWREALADLNEELRIDPGSAEAEYEIGEIYRKHDQPQAAVAAFQRSLERDPNAVPARIGLAKALRQLGEKRQALAALQPAEKSAPGDPAVRFLLVQLYRDLGNASQASREEAAFERLQKSAPR